VGGVNLPLEAKNELHVYESDERGFVTDAKPWVWSGYGFCHHEEEGLCMPDGVEKLGMKRGTRSETGTNFNTNSENETENHPPFAKAAKDGAPAKSNP
jgi:hypothetical protein